MKAIGGEINSQDLNDNFSDLDSRKMDKGELPFTSVGNAAKFKSSAYIPNDDNLFGYKANGDYTNIATVQQNDILQFGDTKTDVMWFIANNYFSFRSQGDPTVQKIDANGSSVGSGRTVFHQGNACHHVILNANGNQTLTQSTRNYLTLLGTAVSSFPSGNLSGIDYTIPRTGVYAFDFTLRPTAITNANSVIRIGFTKDRSGTPDHTDARDIIATSAYGSGFYGGTFFYHLTAGDVITPFANPLNEAITLQSGTKVYIYFMGDRPAA